MDRGSATLLASMPVVQSLVAISIDSLGTNEAMLSGNLVAILFSGFIHYVYSTSIDPQDYDFSTLDASIKL